MSYKNKLRMGYAISMALIQTPPMLMYFIYQLSIVVIKLIRKGYTEEKIIKAARKWAFIKIKRFK